MKVPCTERVHTQHRAAALWSNGGTLTAILDKLRLGRTSTSSVTNQQPPRYVPRRRRLELTRQSFPTRSHAWSLRTNPPFALSARANSTREPHRRQAPCAWPQWPPARRASTMWGGLFEVKPGARTDIHHHGERQTIAYVLSGVCEIRWGAGGEYVARKGWRLHPCAGFLSTHGDQSFGFGAFLVGRREEQINANRREPSGPYVAIAKR